MELDDHTHSASVAGLPVAPALGTVLEDAQVPTAAALFDSRALLISGLGIALGICAALVARVLVRLIALFTNLFFYQEFSFEPTSPAGNHLGGWVIFVPVVGGFIIGFMARYGSKAIRGHGIPEAMEQVLTNSSRSDVLSAYRRRIDESRRESPNLTLPLSRGRSSQRKTA